MYDCRSERALANCPCTPSYFSFPHSFPNNRARKNEKQIFSFPSHFQVPSSKQNIVEFIHISQNFLSHSNHQNHNVQFSTLIGVVVKPQLYHGRPAWFKTLKRVLKHPIQNQLTKRGDANHSQVGGVNVQKVFIKCA